MVKLENIQFNIKLSIVSKLCYTQIDRNDRNDFILV